MNALTVVIPTYKRPDDLRACLESIRTNSVTNPDVLVYHPETDLEAATIAAQWGARAIVDGSRVNGVRVKSLWGILNDGIEASATPFACWLNDDCLVNPGWDKTALSYFSDDVGLVVLKTKGIAEVPEYRVATTRWEVPSANYGVLRKAVPVRFDQRFHWFGADDDLSLELLRSSSYRVVATAEDLVIHNHRRDLTRVQNENDQRASADHVAFHKKWRFSSFQNGRVVNASFVRAIAVLVRDGWRSGKAWVKTLGRSK